MHCTCHTKSRALQANSYNNLNKGYSKLGQVKGDCSGREGQQLASTHYTRRCTTCHKSVYRLGAQDLESMVANEFVKHGFNVLLHCVVDGPLQASCCLVLQNCNEPRSFIPGLFVHFGPKVSAWRVGDSGFESQFSPVVTQSLVAGTYKAVIQWRSWSALRLVGPVSIYYERQVSCTTYVSVWQHVNLPKQIRPWGTLVKSNHHHHHHHNHNINNNNSNNNNNNNNS